MAVLVVLAGGAAVAGAGGGGGAAGAAGASAAGAAVTEFVSIDMQPSHAATKAAVRNWARAE